MINNFYKGERNQMSYIIAIGAYLVLLMIYGLVIAHKKVKTTDDMMTGGHKIPFIILVGSLLATWCGGGGKSTAAPECG